MEHDFCGDERRISSVVSQPEGRNCSKVAVDISALLWALTSGSVMLCRLVLVMFWVVLITRLQSLLLVGVHNLYWVAIPSDKMFLLLFCANKSFRRECILVKVC